MDDYRAISLLNTIVNINAKSLALAATAILIADGVLVAAVPDSGSELIALQVVATILAFTASAPLFVGAKVNSIVQGNTPIGK